MPTETLVPVEGCWVQRLSKEGGLGRVVQRQETDNGWRLRIDWGDARHEWAPLPELRCGLQPGWAVQDVPLSTTRRPLGPARVVNYRRIGDREQILVQLDADGRSLWLPYENLRRIKDPQLRFVRAETAVDDHAERFRLRLLAHALENWNFLTGSLDRLDVDPLPHQIQLVHRILSSGNYNWLIADDVGLGKTIEVGLLLAALKRKGQARRVLVVSPAGLTRQWQDEMQYKFDQPYQIYGRDFQVHKPEHWKLYDHVIVSIDLAKRDDHMQRFREAGGWDIVVFDEGHKLTRHASGERAQRYRLAEMLRPNADAFLLLSGTPHQGYADRFIAILELVRPDLKPEIHALEANPEVVRELILRNRKSEVTDADGEFIFKGQQIHRVPIEPSEATRRFHALLHEYLIKGYRAGEGQAAMGRAIGFVMTTYRKLASSSIAAIERALQLRLARLVATANTADRTTTSGTLTIEDLSEGGDEQDDLSDLVSATRSEEFFAYERDLIGELLSEAATVRNNDEKLRIFIDEVVTPLVREGKKLLVFTEYRATQTYLQGALERQFADVGPVVLINGSMNLDEKLESIDSFNRSAPFMISTEAGGEGINLQEACHVMVNYDLPWNPARLIQRIGRLYRYGQQETVVVFNLHARDSFDNRAIAMMLDRVMTIVRDMAPVGEEYNERLYAEILGEVLDNLDLAAILQSATDMEITRTRDQIDEALDRARTAQRLQAEIFSHVEGYDPDALRGTLGFTMDHVNGFIRGMLRLIDAEIVDETHRGQALDIRLPEELRGAFPEFAQRTVVRVTTDRRLAQKARDLVLLDFETPFFQFLVETAKSHEFDGIYASVASADGATGFLAAFKLRWQNDQGEPLTEDLLPLFSDGNGRITENPDFLAAWLLAPKSSAAPPNPDPATRNELFGRFVDTAHRRLASECSRFKHPNGVVQIAAADVRRGMA
ncbi:MAG: DEAD/DEAH box helicase [Rhodospirillaceae bacterium]